MVPFAIRVKGEWYQIDLGMAKSRLDEQLDCWGEPIIKLI